MTRDGFSLTVNVMNANARRIPVDTIALRVRMIRDELGISQREMALKSGLTYGEIQSIEGGAQARGLDKKVPRIADAFGYDREWLMYGGALTREDDAPNIQGDDTYRGTTGRKSADSRPAFEPVAA